MRGVALLALVLLIVPIQSRVHFTCSNECVQDEGEDEGGDGLGGRRCPGIGSRCSTDLDCSVGMVCCDRACHIAPGSSCGQDFHCCPQSGLGCNTNPFDPAIRQVCCNNTGWGCTNDRECCSLICEGRRCRNPFGFSCNATTPCATGLTCVQGLCDLAQCQTPGTPCNAKFPCCEGARCLNNTVCCAGLLTPCHLSSECCDEGAECVRGVCVSPGNNIHFTEPGSFDITLPQGTHSLALTLCGAGGAGGHPKYGTGGGGGAGACIHELLIGDVGSIMQLRIGRGGKGLCGLEDTDGARGEDSVLTIPDTGRSWTAFGGGGGGRPQGGGGGGGGGPGMTVPQKGGPPSDLFEAAGGDGGDLRSDTPPGNSQRARAFESGAGGGSGGLNDCSIAPQSGGNSTQFEGGSGGEIGVCGGGGGASLFAPGGNGANGHGNDGKLGSGGGGSIVDGPCSGAGGHGLATIQLIDP